MWGIFTIFSSIFSSKGLLKDLLSVEGREGRNVAVLAIVNEVESIKKEDVT